MQLVDFLGALLRLHRGTLAALSERYTDSGVTALIEATTDDDGTMPEAFEVPEFNVGDYFSDGPLKTEGTTASRWKHQKPDVYDRLEKEVQSGEVSFELEFYLWAYPFYRKFVESALNLDAHFTGNKEAAQKLIRLATDYSETWLKNLKLPGTEGVEMEKKAAPLRVRFRAEVLKELGFQSLEKMSVADAKS